MYDNYWESLAEFYIAKKEDYDDWNKHTYCMCSRIIVGNAGPIFYEDKTEVGENDYECERYESNANACIGQLDDLHITPENDSNKLESQCKNKISEKLVYVSELDCTVTLCLASRKSKVRKRHVKIKNKNKLFDGCNLFLKAGTTAFDRKTLIIVFECFILQNKNFVDSLARDLHDTEKVARYSLITPENFYKIYKCDLIKSYKLLHVYKVYKYANQLLHTSIFHFNWEEFWNCNGEYIIWLSWILKFKNFINGDYLYQLVDIVNQLQCGIKSSKYFKTTVQTQIAYLINQKNQESEITQPTIINNSKSKSNNCKKSIFTEDQLKLDDYIATYLTPENETVWQYLWQYHYQEQFNNCCTFFKAYCAKQIDLLRKICLTLDYNLTKANQPSLIYFEKNKSKEIFEKFVVALMDDLKKRFECEIIYDLRISSNILPLYGLYENYCNQYTDQINTEIEQNIENGLEKSFVTGLDEITEVLKLIGFACEPDVDYYQLQGEVTYRKKNIKYLNRQLRMNWAYENRYFMINSENSKGRKDMDQENKVHTSNGFTNNLEKHYDLSADMENNTSDIIEDQENEQMIESNINNDTGLSESYSEVPENQCNENDEPNTSKDKCNGVKKSTKKRKRNKNKNKNSNLPDYVQKNPILKKYYAKRYRLFSKFDDGIILDEESWFSVTPEKIAKHLAERCRSDIMIDAFCGAGGNSIHFAFTCERVYAIDIDPQKIAMARHNAQIYGVEDRIEFIIGDFFCLAERLFGDVVFLSPPWGGPSYIQDNSFDIKNIMPPKGGTELLQTAKKISDNVAYYLPKNINTLQLAVAAGSGSKIEIEQNFLGTQLVAVTAYFGDLLK